MPSTVMVAIASEADDPAVAGAAVRKAHDPQGRGPYPEEERTVGGEGRPLGPGMGR